MSLLRDVLLRHTLRLLLLIIGAVALLASPPALSAGLPGPGLWPRVAGTGLLVAALLLPARRAPRPPLTADALRGARSLILACLLWMALVPALGWSTASFVTAFLACRYGGCSLKEALGLSFLLCLSLWIGMDRLLAWPLPQGALFSLLSGV